MEEKHCALIVDENIERRARLILAMRAASLFATIHVARSLDEVELRLSEEPVDIVFIGIRENEDVIAKFITRFRQEAAYVLLLEGQRHSAEAARTLVDGADAILSEPYSLESLRAISELAESVKRERSRVRLRPALQLLVREIAAQLDLVARLEKSGSSALISRSVLWEMCSVLRDLDEEVLSLYYEVALKVFPELPGNGAPHERRTDSLKLLALIAATQLNWPQRLPPEGGRGLQTLRHQLASHGSRRR